MSGSIAGSVVTYTTTQNINLTSLGSVDWAAFGYNANSASIERKSSGGSKISALSQVGSQALANWNDSGTVPVWSATWTDGTPDASISGESYVVFSGNGPANGAGMSFTVPADTTSRTLTIYVAVSNNTTTATQGKLTATLSDASAGPYSDTSIGTVSSDSNSKLGIYTIVYNAASAGQTLTVQWLNNTSNGQNVQIFAAALSNTASVPVNTAVPTISGTAAVGNTLTATNGTWTGSPTSYIYEWTSSSPTYVPVAGDIGNTIQVSVIAKNAAGASAPATSSATSAVTSTVTLASLTAHNTSAFNAYNQTNFPANFGTASNVNNATAVTIDPTKMDLSMNAVTPGHVSNVDVHTLVPSRTDLRWFAHVMAGWWGSGQPQNAATSAVILNGYTSNTTAWVAALITDLVARGFNGCFLVWNGIGSPADNVALKVQSYIAANLAGKFTYAILIDEGLINGLTAYPATGAGSKYNALTTAINYLNTTYFGDSNYEKEGTKAFLPMYGVGDSLGDAGMNAAYASVGSTSVWGQNGTGHLTATWSSFAFDWTDNFVNYASPGYNTSDPYNTGALNSFYATMAGSSKKGMGAITGGFNGTLTGATSWSLGKFLPQEANSGLIGAGAVIARANFVDANIHSSVTRMQWATWNDYAEGSPVEMGYENKVVVTASVSGNNLNWTFTSGTGDDTTIHHYEIYVSPDGVNAIDLGTVATGTNTFVLSGRGLVTGHSYTAYVYAVGKPCIRNHLSNGVSFTGP